MAPNELANLARTGLLKLEPGEQREFDGLLAAGEAALSDSDVVTLSEQGRFSRAYAAAHAFSLAALRWHGFRPDNKRYIVFQVLPHTLGIKPELVRVLDKCHLQRNLAEYEGSFETDALLLRELIGIAHELHARVRGLGPIA